MQALVEQVRTYIEDNFLYMRADVELDNDESLLKAGIVDSMGVMEVIAFLEDEFGVTVADEDITEENLGTVNSIARYAEANGAAIRSQVA